MIKHLNTEISDLLILPENFNKKEKLLYKWHFRISPYWMDDLFNGSIIYLKKEFSPINPLYTDNDSWMDDKTFKRLLESLEDICP